MEKLSDERKAELLALADGIPALAYMGDEGQFAGEVRTCDTFTEICVDANDDGRSALRFMVEAANALPTLLAELAAANAVLAKLPKTADGVPIVPGMPIYREYGMELRVEELTAHQIDGQAVFDGIHWLNGSRFYSTREAAAKQPPAS